MVSCISLDQSFGLKLCKFSDILTILGGGEVGGCSEVREDGVEMEGCGKFGRGGRRW